MPGPEITVVADAAALAEAAADAFVEAATAAVAARGRFTVALAGGSTPRTAYELLARPPRDRVVPWTQTHVFFGDERGVGPEHADSNYRMAHTALLAKVPVPSAQVYRVRGDAPDPEEAAAEYARTLADVFGTRRGELPRFDLVLLGIGIDGHTASLFPGSPVLKEVFRTVAAVHATAAVIPQRFTLTLPVFNAAARVVVLASGAEKAKVIRAALADKGTSLPPAMIAPPEGRLTWLLDRAAAALLPPTP